jgi:hypothetical protein
MADDDTVSRWLECLRAGDAADIRRLWDPRRKRGGGVIVHTNEAIADELGTSPRTVDRELNVIRKIWEGEPE